MNTIHQNTNTNLWSFGKVHSKSVLSVCLFSVSVCLSVSQSLCFSVYLTITYWSYKCPLSIFLSICLSSSICLSMFLSIILSLYIDLSIWVYVCLSDNLTICLPIWLSVCLYDYLSVHMTISLRVCISVYLPVYLSAFFPFWIYRYTETESLNIGFEFFFFYLGEQETSRVRAREPRGQHAGGVRGRQAPRGRSQPRSQGPEGQGFRAERHVAEAFEKVSFCRDRKVERQRDREADRQRDRERQRGRSQPRSQGVEGQSLRAERNVAEAFEEVRFKETATQTDVQIK